MPLALLLKIRPLFFLLIRCTVLILIYELFIRRRIFFDSIFLHSLGQLFVIRLSDLQIVIMNPLHGNFQRFFILSEIGFCQCFCRCFIKPVSGFFVSGNQFINGFLVFLKVTSIHNEGTADGILP